MASSVFGAVAQAKEFFESDFWKGPKPTVDTLYRVHLVADERMFLVPAEALERWQSRLTGTPVLPQISS
jgi:hypothetical protein